MELTEGQLSALRGLRSKKAGEDVDWINIADARTLTELGLAERNREGWIITGAGEVALQALEAEPERDAPPTEFSDEPLSARVHVIGEDLSPIRRG